MPQPLDPAVQALRDQTPRTAFVLPDAPSSAAELARAIRAGDGAHLLKTLPARSPNAWCRCAGAACPPACTVLRVPRRVCPQSPSFTAAASSAAISTATTACAVSWPPRARHWCCRWRIGWHRRHRSRLGLRMRMTQPSGSPPLPMTLGSIHDDRVGAVGALDYAGRRQPDGLCVEEQPMTPGLELVMTLRFAIASH